MKQIFSYSLPFKQKQDITETLPNGDKIIKSIEKETPVKVVIKEPTRLETQSARDIYNREWSRCVTNGIVTRAILDKKYRAENGIFTPEEIKNLDETKKRIQEIRDEYLVLEKIKDKTAEDNEKINDLLTEFSAIQSSLDELDRVNENLYSNTAEALAKQKEITYNILFLSYIEEKGKLVPLIPGDTLEDKLDNYDAILEPNDDKSKLYFKIIERNGYFVNMLSRGKMEVSQLEALNKQWDINEIEAKKEAIKKDESEQPKTSSDSPVADISPEVIKD